MCGIADMVLSVILLLLLLVFILLN